MRPSPRRLITVSTACCALVAGAAAPALAGGMPTTGTSAGASSVKGPRSVVRDSNPSWTSYAPRVASAPPSKSINARVYLMPRDEAALGRAVAAVSDPASASYGHYVTPAQFRAKYGPAPDAATKVSAWLRGQGLRVSSLQANGRYLEVSGTVAAAQRAFGQDLSLYRRGAGTYLAPSGELTVPTALSRYVLTVTGLDESPARVSPKTAVGMLPSQLQVRAAERQKRPASNYPAGYRNAKPCSLAFGQVKAILQADYKTPLPKFHGRTLPYATCGYTPSQLRKAYGAPGNLTGKGVTVAIIDAYMSPTLLTDANRFASKNGGKAFAAGQFSALVPAGGYTDQGVCDAPSWSSEQALDVEAVHGFAPDANVLYVAGRSCSAFDLFQAEMATVDDNRASIVSISYGGYESQETAGVAAIETYVLQQAAMQGIGFYVASGDAGDELQATGYKQVDTSANNPYVTAVGGTSLGLSRKGGYWFEAGWGTRAFSLSDNGKSWLYPMFVNGSGGGRSALFDRPDYQHGVVGGGGRAVPDVSMLGDPNTGMKVGFTQQFPDGVYYDELRVGGTSLSTPLFAAVQALTSQAQQKRLGFANPRIYSIERRLLAGVKGTPKAFHDVRQGPGGLAVVRADYGDGVSASSGLLYTVRTFDDDTSLNTRYGWDPVTGVGSPTTAYYYATGGPSPQQQK